MNGKHIVFIFVVMTGNFEQFRLGDLWSPDLGITVFGLLFFDIFVQQTADESAFVVIVTGPAEDDLFLDRVEKFCRGQEGTAHAGDADLTGLAALLGHCSVYVGNDSGASHLAAATGAPTIVLFGPSDPVVWGPVGRRVEVIAAADLDAITVVQVGEAVRRSIARAAGAEQDGPF